MQTSLFVMQNNLYTTFGCLHCSPGNRIGNHMTSIQMFGCTSNSYWKHQPIQSCFSAHVKLPPTIQRAPAPFCSQLLGSRKTYPFDPSDQKRKEGKKGDEMASRGDLATRVATTNRGARRRRRSVPPPSLPLLPIPCTDCSAPYRTPPLLVPISSGDHHGQSPSPPRPGGGWEESWRRPPSCPTAAATTILSRPHPHVKQEDRGTGARGDNCDRGRLPIIYT